MHLITEPKYEDQSPETYVSSNNIPDVKSSAIN
jgi:hypothetical protein